MLTYMQMDHKQKKNKELNKQTISKALYHALSMGLKVGS